MGFVINLPFVILRVKVDSIYYNSMITVEDGFEISAQFSPYFMGNTIVRLLPYNGHLGVICMIWKSCMKSHMKSYEKSYVKSYGHCS